MNDDPYRRGPDGRYPPDRPIGAADYEHRFVDPDGTMHLWNGPADDDRGADILYPDDSFGLSRGRGRGMNGGYVWHDAEGYPVPGSSVVEPGVPGVDTALPSWEYRLQKAEFGAMMRDARPRPTPAAAAPRRHGLLGRLFGVR